MDGAGGLVVIFAKFMLAIGTLTTAVQPQLDRRACLSDAEATDMVMVVAPEALRIMREKCAAVLPADAALLQTTSPINEGFRAAGVEAWPRALPNLVRVMLANGEAVSAQERNMTRATFSAGMAGIMKDMIKPEDCGSANRLFTLMQPLPPSNIAGILMEIMHIGMRDDARKGKPKDFPLCER